jgi:pyruvate/2-oxoglutarate dehydrogenase complex dihydrolipoamide acyltransferase (E2) component
MEIREIVVPEINSSVDLPQVALPQAPPITLDIGVPVIEIPHFNPMDMEPEVEPQPVKPAAPRPADPPAAKPPPVKLPTKEAPKSEAPPAIPEPTVEMKPLPQRIIEAIPTIPQAVNTAGTSAIAISAALATPILLKAIRPLMKKVLKKLQKALGKKVKVESVYERRKFQRSLRR